MTREEAQLLLDRINTNGGVVLAADKRRLVEAHNSFCEGNISYSAGCQTCVKKAYARLTEWFAKNPVKKGKAKKATKAKEEAPKVEAPAETSDNTVEAQHPEGDPSSDWTIKQIKAYMTLNNIEFKSRDKEDVLLASCAAHKDSKDA